MLEHIVDSDQVIVTVVADGKPIAVVSLPWYVEWAVDNPGAEVDNHSQAIARMAVDRITNITEDFSFRNLVHALAKEDNVVFTITLNEDVRWDKLLPEIPLKVEGIY